MNVDRAGVSRRVIVQITGHKTEAMFLRYRIVNSRDLSDAAHRMEENGRLPQTARHGQGYGQGGIIYGMGRLVGFEPTTFGTTIRRSTT